MKFQKLREYGWTSRELKQDQQAFFNVFNVYIIQFSIIEDALKLGNDDFNNKLALYRVIQTVPHSLIKSTSTEAQWYLNEPLLKKADKMTYSQYWKGASTFYPILARMARDYSTILSTSVPSKSVFSIAGLQITKRRNRLALKTIRLLMCLKSWGLLNEDSDHECSDSDGEDIRKDRAFGRAEPDEVIMSSQPHEHQE
jgi:hypothetical protein